MVDTRNGYIHTFGDSTRAALLCALCHVLDAWVRRGMLQSLWMDDRVAAITGVGKMTPEQCNDCCHGSGNGDMMVVVTEWGDSMRDGYCWCQGDQR
jgi:hypothetical protein